MNNAAQLNSHFQSWRNLAKLQTKFPALICSFVSLAKSEEKRVFSQAFFCELFVNLTYLTLHTSRDFSRLNSSSRIAFKIYIFCAQYKLLKTEVLKYWAQ